MSKKEEQTIITENTLQKILDGSSKVSQVVGDTLGPRGRFCIYEEHDQASVSNDGVTIAEQISLDDKTENLAAKVLITVAKQANDESGDGTTTSIVLSDAIIQEGLKALEDHKINPLIMEEGMRKTVKYVVDLLQKKSRKIETEKDIENVAALSAGDKNIGKMISEAIKKIGEHGIISIQEGKGHESTLETSKGMKFDNGLISRYLSNNDKNEFITNSCYVLVTNDTLSTVEQAIAILQIASKFQPLLVIADDVKDIALTTIIINKKPLSLDIGIVKAPSFGEEKQTTLEDIALFTNGTFINNDIGLSVQKNVVVDNDVKGHYLGKCSFVNINDNNLTIINDNVDKTAIAEKQNSLLSILNDKTLDKFEQDKIAQRISRLQGSVAVIRAGGTTETEMKTLKLQIEDAVNATRAAIVEGILVGGGSSLVKIALDLENMMKNNAGFYKDLSNDEKVGYEVITKAITYPTKRIIKNCHLNPDVILNDLKKSMVEHEYSGFNANTLEVETDLLKLGIIDPVKVIRTSLESALSGSAMLLRCNSAIIKKSNQNNTDNSNHMH